MNDAYIPPQLPETMTKQEIGAHMAMLRKQFNLTQHEVSERLHIRTHYITAIEDAAFERMPGKVYARGYIHTYAEFLGLDAEQVVTQCFANDTAVATPTARAPMLAKQSPAMAANPWRGRIILTVAVLVALLVGRQFFANTEDMPVDEMAVAPVPEAMLQTMRTAMMPTPDNFDCLTRDAALTCFYADAISHEMTVLTNASPRFLGDLDVSPLAILPVEPVSDDAGALEKTEETSAPSDTAHDAAEDGSADGKVSSGGADE